MGIQAIRGRVFTVDDNHQNAPKVAVINDRLAHELFADQNPIGRQIRLSHETTWEVIGVVGSVRDSALDLAPRSRFYAPASINPWATSSLVVRTKFEVQTLSEKIRQEIRSISPDQSLSNLRSLQAVVSSSYKDRALAISITAVFAVAAMIISCVGIYGVVSYTVAQRTYEVGIRMALGAGRRQIIIMILRDALRLGVIGLTIGLVAALVLGKTSVGLLISAQSFDSAIYLEVVLLVLIVVSFSALWPALRASRLEPLRAMK
jgi:putative ABC transport system permease protein